MIFQGLMFNLVFRIRFLQIKNKFHILMIQVFWVVERSGNAPNTLSS